MGRIVTASLVFLFAIVPIWPFSVMDDCVMPLCQEVELRSEIKEMCSQCPMVTEGCNTIPIFLLTNHWLALKEFSDFKTLDTIFIRELKVDHFPSLHIDNHQKFLVYHAKTPLYFLHHSLLI